MRTDFRARVVEEMRSAAQAQGWDQLIAAHGTPLMLFDPDRLRASIRSLTEAMPDVTAHYAVKAQPDHRVLGVVAAEGARFDVASRAEVDLVGALGFPMHRCLYSNPHKKRIDIAYAAALGIERFVVDNPGEIHKLASAAPGAKAMIRVCTPGGQAHCDLSTKFGAAPEEAVMLVKTALSVGVVPEGICLHVGSQCEVPSAFHRSIVAALELVDAIDRETGVRLSVLDIGGGFPVPYLHPVPSAHQIAEQVDRAFGSRRSEFDILAEPGRYLVAPSMTLVTSVVGSSTRSCEQWRFLDDGLYGSYSNVLAEQITPAIVSGSEIFDAAQPTEPMVLAGPTCDGVDVVIRDHPMPPLAEGDLVFSPMMGAYTTATATGFNGFGAAPIVDVSATPKARTA